MNVCLVVLGNTYQRRHAKMTNSDASPTAFAWTAGEDAMVRRSVPTVPTNAAAVSSTFPGLLPWGVIS